MKLQTLNYIGFVLFMGIFSACENKNVSSPAEDVNAVTGEPVVVKATDEVIDETGTPRYLNVELKGYKTPDINLNSLYGEVIFVNFWGSWCPPCRIEMPSIQSLYDDYGQSVKFAMIAYEKVPGKHIEFINENGYTFPVYEAISPMDPELKPQGFPTTIIIDKKGNMLIKDIGAKDWNGKEVRAKLDELLAQ